MSRRKFRNNMVWTVFDDGTHPARSPFSPLTDAVTKVRG